MLTGAVACLAVLMIDPMVRLGRLHLEEASPEVQLTVREVGRAATKAASALADTWYRRANEEWIDPQREEHALFAVVNLERHGDSPSAELKSLPLLPEAPPSVEPGRTLTGELADLRTALPFADDELTVLRNGLAAWDFDAHFASGYKEPELAPPELLAKWQEWLREPPDADDVMHVRADALAVHVLCLRLGKALTIAETDRNDSVTGW